MIFQTFDLFYYKMQLKHNSYDKIYKKFGGRILKN